MWVKEWFTETFKYTFFETKEISGDDTYKLLNLFSNPDCLQIMLFEMLQIYEINTV